MSMLKFIKGYKAPKSKQPEQKNIPKYDKEYEKNKRDRVYISKWEQGRKWLKNTSSGMVCTYCQDAEGILKNMKMHITKQFINGCTSYRVESVSSHEQSDSHKEATKIHQRQEHPEEAEAQKARTQLNLKNYPKLKIMFQNCHALAKHQRPFRDFVWLCELDQAKGLDVGKKRYRNETAARTFTKYIAEDASKTLTDDIKDAKFLSVTSDGSTDSSTKEQEIVFVRYAKGGKIFTKFVATKSPRAPDARGIHEAIMKALKTINIDEDVLQRKLVAFGCDGASVMIGKKNGVAALLKHLQPSVIIVHCLAHRLELAYKDAVKTSSSAYKDTIALLMGIYFFYHNSGKQKTALQESYQAMNVKTVIPTRVSGTRWLGHLYKALCIFLRGYPVIHQQLQDCAASKIKTENKNKAVGYLRLMEKGSVIAYMHLLRDVLEPLTKLSKALQIQDTTIAEASEKMEAAKEQLTEYENSDGPWLEGLWKNLAENNNKFKGVTVKYPISSATFDRTRSVLCRNILDAFNRRFADVGEGVMQATIITSFNRWPKHGDKEQVRSELFIKL